jgi:hypothetical protein
MTAAEIEAELVRLATKHGVAIGLSGSRPPSEP